MSNEINKLRTDFPNVNIDSIMKQGAKDLAEEIDRDIIDSISLAASIKKVKECNYMLSLNTVYQTIILKKRTHKVFNRIRYNEFGMQENFLINVQKFRNKEEQDEYVRDIMSKYRSGTDYSKDYSNHYKPNAYIGGCDAVDSFASAINCITASASSPTKEYVDDIEYMKNKLHESIGVPKKYLRNNQ